MSWFSRKPSKEMIAANEATARVEEAAQERKSALSKLIAALDAIPLDNTLADLGKDLTDARRNGR